MSTQHVCPTCGGILATQNTSCQSCSSYKSPIPERELPETIVRDANSTSEFSSADPSATVDSPTFNHETLDYLVSGFTNADGVRLTTLGRFQIRTKLGEGAFGEVYRAYDPQLDREVALKVAKPGTLTTPDRVKRFLREAKAAAGLRHPNIVPLYEAGQDQGRYYIASAFIPGKTLEGVIKAARAEQKTVPLVEAVQYVRKLAEALAYAHKQGVVHRDVKPQNVMVDEQSEPHLLDFGLAARADSGDERLTQDGTAMGTPAYLAPEQAEGHGIAPSDQYSLGCTLYELFTGRTPFTGGPTQQILLHQTQAVSSPRKVRPDLPATSKRSA